jgi:hypothetical protein
VDDRKLFGLLTELSHPVRSAPLAKYSVLVEAGGEVDWTMGVDEQWWAVPTLRLTSVDEREFFWIADQSESFRAFRVAGKVLSAG